LPAAAPHGVADDGRGHVRACPGAEHQPGCGPPGRSGAGRAAMAGARGGTPGRGGDRWAAGGHRPRRGPNPGVAAGPARGRRRSWRKSQRPEGGERAMTTVTKPAPVSLQEFDEIFETVKNWGRWGPDDELGTLNYITPETVRAAAALVRSGRRATMAIPMNTPAGPDNPHPSTRHVVQGHDIDIGSSGVTFATDFVGLAFHGDCHTHMDALCHIAYRGRVYNGRPAQEVMTSQGATALDVTT